MLHRYKPTVLAQGTGKPRHSGHHKVKMRAKYSIDAKYRASWRQRMKAKYSIDANYRTAGMSGWNRLWDKRCHKKRTDSSFRKTERRKLQHNRHIKRVSDPVAAFTQHIQEDPVHTCVSCHRHLYWQSVVKLNMSRYKSTSQQLLATMLAAGLVPQAKRSNLASNKVNKVVFVHNNVHLVHEMNTL